MLRRKIDRILSEGEGKQLLWLTVLVLALFIIFCLLGRIWGLDWTDILTLYLDPGNFPIDHRANDYFSLIVTLCGILILSALLVSVFSNVFTNISEAYRKGERRYRFNGHVLILGGSRMLSDMLKQMQHQGEYEGKDIVIMTCCDVETLRERIETMLDDKRFCNRITWYRGERDNEEFLSGARIGTAAAIYLIGEDCEQAHDATNIKTLDLLEKLCGNSGPSIPCFITLDEQTTMDVFHYLPKTSHSRLRTELIRTSDYVVEQLLVYTDFIPIPKKEQYLHLVIAGNTSISHSFATVASQICHFPDYAVNGKRTIITFVGTDMKNQMDKFVANHQSLFQLSHYHYVTPEGRVSHVPDKSYGDFLDVEWEFVESSIESPFVRYELCRWINDSGQTLAIAICNQEPAENLTVALHLPEEVYAAKVPVAVYQQEHGQLMEKAIASGMYGGIVCFGEATESNDALLLRRSLRGKRVNYLYDQAYGTPPAPSVDHAWASISFAHQLSSIASANSIPIKLRSFGLEATKASVDTLDSGTLDSLSEVEHRRWMSSILLMGYRAAPKAERAERSHFKDLKTKYFIHLDIAPYQEIGSEAEKDLIIVKNIPYIIKEETYETFES